MAKGDTLSFCGLLPLALYTETESAEVGVEARKSTVSKTHKSSESDPRTSAEPEPRESSDSNESKEP